MGEYVQRIEQRYCEQIAQTLCSGRRLWPTKQLTLQRDSSGYDSMLTYDMTPQSHQTQSLPSIEWRYRVLPTFCPAKAVWIRWLRVPEAYVPGGATSRV